MASQLSSKTNVAAQLTDAIRARGSATRQWAVSWVTRTAGMTEKSAEKVVSEAVAKSMLIERDGALMPRHSSHNTSARSPNPTRGTTVANAKKASKKSSAKKPAKKSSELTAEQKAAVAEGKALLNSIQGGGSTLNEAVIKRSAKKPSAKKPPSAKKASAKKHSAKPASKKASAKKPSAKPASKKASAKKPSAKPASKKASAKKPSAKRTSAKPASKKASRKSTKKASAKKPSAKRASRKSAKPASKKASAKKASAKKPSAKRASRKSTKKASAKRASRKSAKPASKKASRKSAKRASKKPSAKKPSAKRASRKSASKKTASRKSRKTAPKKASAKKTSRKPRVAKRASAKKASRKSNKKRPAKRASAKKASAKKASRKPRAAKRASAKKASRKPKTRVAKKPSAKKRPAKKSTSRKGAKRSSTKAANKEKKMKKSRKAQPAATASKPKRRSAKSRAVSSLKSAEHAVAKLSDKPRKPRAQKRPAKPAKTVPVGRYTNKKGAQIVIHRTYARSNPAMGLVDLAAAGGGLLVGIIAADVTDRLVATRAPKDAKEALNGTAAKDALQRPADGVRLLVQGGATGVFGLAAFLLRDRVPTAAAGVAGVAVGFGSNFITKLVADVIMPKLFKAKDAADPTIGNRLYADTQEYAYPAATALPFGFRRQGYRGLPGFLGAPKSTTQRPFERAPEAVGPVASGAVGCSKCGGGANDPVLRAGIKNIDLARLFPGAQQKCTSCEQVKSQLPVPPLAVVIPKPLPINPGRVPQVELPKNPPRVSVKLPRVIPSPSKKKREREAAAEDTSRQGTTRVVDLIAGNRPAAVARIGRVLGRKDRGYVK